MTIATRRTVLLGLSASLASPVAARVARVRADRSAIEAIAQYEAASGGHIGVFARNLRNGKSFAWRADSRVVMCSTFKASLAGLVLSRIDRGQGTLSEVIRFGPADVPEDWYAPVARANLARGFLSVEEMCQASVEQSDNSCATILLDRVGGPAAVTAYWRSLGDRVSRLDDPEPILNRTPLGGVRNTTTPRAMAHVLQAMVLGENLSPASRGLLLAWLKGSQTGFNRLRAGLPKTWVVGDKTGNNGKDAAGDIALAWPRPDVPIVISAYTRGGTPTPEQFEAVFAGIGRHVAATLA